MRRRSGGQASCNTHIEDGGTSVDHAVLDVDDLMGDRKSGTSLRFPGESVPLPLFPRRR